MRSIVLSAFLLAACGGDDNNNKTGTHAVCGDGEINLAAEQCDDGNTTSGDGCSASCQIETASHCGDGTIDSSETCDDGNTVDGDGCSATCQTESVAPGDGTCAHPIVVAMTGTGTQTGSGSGDTTSMTDQIPATRCDLFETDGGGKDELFQFTLAAASDVHIEVVGDADSAIRLMTTACDVASQVHDHHYHDGCADELAHGENLDAQALPAGTYYLSVDGYDMTAAGPFTFTITASPATVAVCGNGVYDDNEECDDGNTAASDRCSPTCTLEFDTAEVEPNDDLAHAQVITPTHHIIKGSLTEADVDLYTFTLTQATTVQIETYDALDAAHTYAGAGTLTGTDCKFLLSVLTLFDATGDVADNMTGIATDDADGDFDADSGLSACAYIGPNDGDGDTTQGVLQPGTYTIKVENFYGAVEKPYMLDVQFSTGGGGAVAPVAGDLVLNEFMAADNVADTNCDTATTGTNDEFVELVNTASHAVDLTGVTISDSMVVRHTFAPATSGSMTLDPGKAVVVWAGGAPACAGVTNWFVASTGQLGLNDAGDTITVKSAADVQLLTYTFGTATPAKSFNLNPDITGTSYVLHDALTGAVGAYSPGKKSNGTAF